MSKKISFILIILLIVVGCDWLIGAVSKDAIRNVKDIGVNQTNSAQALFSRKADVLILGSSRANHSFDCNVLEQELGMSCYNAGRDGMNIMYDGMVLFSYIERHQPKLVVLDVAASMLDDSWNDTWHDMICFYGMSDALDQIADSLASPIEKIQLKSNIYRYNKTWEWLLKAELSTDQSSLDGYRPMPVHQDHPTKVNVAKQHFVPDVKNMKMLDRMAEACQKNQIQLVLTYTPSLNVDKGNFHDFLKEYGKQHHLQVIDWNGDTTYTKHFEWFYDMTHLNEEGAKSLTKDFISKLKMK